VALSTFQDEKSYLLQILLTLFQSKYKKNRKKDIFNYLILSLKNSGGTTYATTLIGEPRNLDINGCIFDDDSGDHKLNEARHGGKISGGPSVGELINMVALAIQKKVTV
jgi:hypothetical protein